MAGHKRPGGPSGGPGPKATVFRKSAKKQRLDSEQTHSKPEPKGQDAHSKQKERGQRPPSATVNGKPRHRDGVQSVKGPKTAIPSRGKDEVALKKVGAKDFKGKPKPRPTAAPEKKKAGGETLMPSTMEIPPPPAPATSFRILAGSYERLLYGFHVTFQQQQQQQQAASSSAQQLQPAFRPIFSFAAHTSSISALAAAGADSKWLATGAGDETVRVWDLRKRKEVGGLTGHGGTILNLSFPARTYLLSTDSSGLINLYRTRDWSLLKTLRGHTGAVNACRAHPSCRLALSVGKDGMLRMWDLMRGKGAGAVRLNLGVPVRDEDEEEDDEDEDEEEDEEEVARSRKRKVPAEEPLDVVWSQSGNHFAVMGRTVVNVYQTDMKLVGAVRVPKDAARKKMASIAFAPSDRDEDGAFLCVGKEEGVVELYDVQANLKLAKAVWDEPSCVLKGHGNRVKSISSIQVVTSPEENKTTRLIVTISSDGKIRIFDIGSVVAGAKGEEVEAIATHDTGGARLTCLGVVGGSGGLAVEREALEEEAVEDDDDDEEDADLSGSDVVGGTDEELDPEEAEELQRLLDLVDEARAQGVEVEGMSDLEGLLEEPDEDDESSGEDDGDVDGEDDEEEEGEEEEDEMENEDDE